MNNISNRTWVLIVILINLVVCVGVYNYFLSPHIEYGKILESSIANKQEEYLINSELIHTLERRENTVQKMNALLITYAPTEVIHKFLANYINANGLTLNSIILREQASSSVQQMPATDVEMVIEGSYRNIMNMLDTVNNTGRTIEISSISVRDFETETYVAERDSNAIVAEVRLIFYMTSVVDMSMPDIFESYR